MKHLSSISAVVAALVFVACASCTSKSSVIESGTTFAKDALQPFVDSGELPGAISVFYHDGVQETCCVGYADVEAKRPITMDDVFMQCSQTKGFCGVTIAKLVEEGKLSLDDPVSKYIPEMADLWVLDSEKDGIRTLHKAKNELTVRMCLNHTGGFPFESCIKQPGIPGGGWTGGAKLRINAAAAAACPLLFEPGTGENYSNTGIDIGAAVVEVVTGMPWNEYLQKEVLDPLGMTSTGFWPSDKQLKTMVKAYWCLKDEPLKWFDYYDWEQPPYNDAHIYPSAGAGIWSTASDQLKFYKMLMNLGVGDNGVRILEEDTVKNLLAVSTRPEGLGGYSLGLWAPLVDSEESWFGHGGALGTNCEINWHTKSLKLWVVQIVGGNQPWNGPLQQAARDFFSSPVVTNTEYVGRTN